MTVCSTSDHKEKHEGIKLTQAVAGINSLNSNRLNPRIQSNASKGVRAVQEEPGRQQENRRKGVAVTVAHQSTLIAFHLSCDKLGGTYFPFGLRRGLTVHHIIFSSHEFARQIAKPSFHFLLWSSSDFLCYVMLPTSPSLSLTPFTYLAGRL